MRGVSLTRRSAGLLALAISLHAPFLLSAQQADALRLTVDPGTARVQVELGGILDSGSLQTSLQAGLPVRVRVVTELWQDRFLDSQEGRHEWRATVRYEPLSEIFRVEVSDGVTLSARSPGEAAIILSEELTVPLRPEAPGRYYYLSRVEVETLALSDLEELRRWLRGDLAPALGGDSEVGSAFGRGLRRLFVRVLGVRAQRFQARTPRFSWEA